MPLGGGNSTRIRARRDSQSRAAVDEKSLPRNVGRSAARQEPGSMSDVFGDCIPAKRQPSAIAVVFRFGYGKARDGSETKRSGCEYAAGGDCIAGNVRRCKLQSSRPGQRFQSALAGIVVSHANISGERIERGYIDDSTAKSRA